MSFRELLVDSQFFYDRACEASATGAKQTEQRCATASVLFSFMAIESFINNMMADFASLPEGILSTHEQGLLQERAVQFASAGRSAGAFVLTKRREYRRLEDKVLFLVRRIAGPGAIDKGSSYWQQFDRLKDLRDTLTHPRKDKTAAISLGDADEALEMAKTIIQQVAAKVWRKPVDL